MIEAEETEQNQPIETEENHQEKYKVKDLKT